MKRIVAAALLSGSVALAGLGAGTVGERGTAGGVQVRTGIIEGDPSPANTCNGAPICLPGR